MSVKRLCINSSYTYIHKRSIQWNLLDTCFLEQRNANSKSFLCCAKLFHVPPSFKRSLLTVFRLLFSLTTFSSLVGLFEGVAGELPSWSSHAAVGSEFPSIIVAPISVLSFSSVFCNSFLISSDFLVDLVDLVDLVVRADFALDFVVVLGTFLT